MLFSVRYYSEMIHPDHFKGKGLRGRWIVFLNWLRYRLEVAIHRHTCAFIADNPAIAESKVKSMFKQLDLDLKQDALERERLSPRTEEVLERPVPPPQPRALRYNMPTVQRALEEMVEHETGVPQRPRKLDNLIGKYGMSGARAQRYVNGRRYTVQDPEGDFEPLEMEDEKKASDARV